jgi:multisubunit Na+/H+ antiporter MnhG subunit
MACTKLRALAWLLMFIFFCAFVLFFVCYVGRDWYVVPDQRAHYPPVSSSTYFPDNPNRPIKFGLFWMCVGLHCKYDLRIDYMIVMYVPFKDTAYAYQQYRTAVMAITTIAACFCLISLASFLIFLAGFQFSRFIGFAAGVAQVAAGVIELIAVIIFGSKFRGSTAMNPFGWSFGLMIVALIILILNGVATILLALVIYSQNRKKSQSSIGKQLTADF